MIRVLTSRGSKFENRFAMRRFSLFLFFFLRLKGKLFLVDYRLAGWFREGKERRILKNDGIKGMTSFRGVLSFFFREIRGIGRFDKGLGKDYVP